MFGGLKLTPYVSFQLVLRSSKLWIPPYSEYQQQLHNKILDLKNKGVSYNKIAEYLNEQGLKTPRNKRFKGGHVYSIIKKKSMRDERLGREYPVEIQNFSIVYY